MYLAEMLHWQQNVWQRMLSAFPGIEGQQMLWFCLFFAVAAEDIVAVKRQFQDVLKSVGFSNVAARCILMQANTTLDELDNLVADSVAEANHKPSFGWDKRFSHRLVNGEDWQADK